MSKFSKKHYEEIAKIMNLIFESNAYYSRGANCWMEIRDTMIRRFEADNPRFDKEEFKRRCEGR